MLLLDNPNFFFCYYQEKFVYLPVIYIERYAFKSFNNTSIIVALGGGG